MAKPRQSLVWKQTWDSRFIAGSYSEDHDTSPMTVLVGLDAKVTAFSGMTEIFNTADLLLFDNAPVLKLVVSSYMTAVVRK